MSLININTTRNGVYGEGWSEEELNAAYGEEKSRKGMAPLMVRDVIMTYSSPHRRLTQSRIIEVLDRFPYAIALNRKSVYRIVNTLCREYPYICKSEDGTVWYDRSRKDDLIIRRAA